MASFVIYDIIRDEVLPEQFASRLKAETFFENMDLSGCYEEEEIDSLDYDWYDLDDWEIEQAKRKWYEIREVSTP